MKQDSNAGPTNKARRRAAKAKDRLIKVNPKAKLPPDLPKNLIYLSRCETRVDHEERVSNEQLKTFYAYEFKHHEDLDDNVAQVSSHPPFFDYKPKFADPNREKFVS